MNSTSKLTGTKSSGKLLFLFLILMQFIFLNGLRAQDPEIKFGKVKDADLNMKVYPQDTSAHAVILADYGETDFRYDTSGDKGWQLFYKRTLRIKIFDMLGASAADFKIKIYHDGTKYKEKLTDVDGITFNLENGKIVKSKLGNKDILEDEIDKHYTSYAFAMPNVREGSVIDVRYSIVSDFIFNLQPWAFQYDIPVQWSEYHVNIPEYFYYNHTLMGYNPLTIDDVTDGKGSVTFNSTNRTSGNVVKSSFESNTIDYTIKRYKLAMKNVPAFKEEAYLTTADNYRSIYSFELATTKGEDNVYHQYTSSWEKINKMMLESSDFGSAIKTKGFLEDDVNNAVNGLSTEKEKAIAITGMIKKKVRWNNYNAVYANDLRKAWNDGKGNAADINLMLISALRTAGLEAEPLALSTRSHGIINPAHPSLTDFNYVVASVLTDGDTMLIDASESYAPAGLLPERCLNGSGRIVSKTMPGWVSLQPKVSDNRSCNYAFSLDADGVVSGKANITHEDYSALNFRKEIARAGSVEDYYNEKEKDISGLKFISNELVDKDSIYKPVIENIEFSLSDAVDMNSGLILISPLLFEATSSNPFKLKERVYPVEFPYPINETIMVNWAIPEGYAVEQLPKPAIVSLPKNAGKFTYNIVPSGNNIMVISMIKINQTIFVKDEYDFIKEFFNQIIAKQAENIVLKKL